MRRVSRCLKYLVYNPYVIWATKAGYVEGVAVGPDNKETPYIVAGSGGFAATPPQLKLGPAPITVGDHTLEKDPIVDFGYLTVTSDARTLSVSFRSPTAHGVKELDSVTVNLRTGKLVRGGHGTSGAKVQSAGILSGKGKTRGSKVSPRGRSRARNAKITHTHGKRKA